ncbi:hypothetical protein ACHAXT_001679 [Thalassiosira profunda]
MRSPHADLAAAIAMSPHRSRRTPTPPHDGEEAAAPAAETGLCNSNGRGNSASDMNVAAEHGLSRSACSEDDDNMNVYTQLDHFETSLDAELQGLEGYLRAPSSAAAGAVAATTASSAEEELADGARADGAPPQETSSGYDAALSRGEERLTLVAPPSSWFQEDDTPIDASTSRDAKKKCTQKTCAEKKGKTSPKENSAEKETQTTPKSKRKNKDAERERKVACGSDREDPEAATSTVHPPAKSTAEQTSKQPTADANQGQTGEGAGEGDDASPDFLPVTLPEYNSPEAHLFDLAPSTPIPKDEGDDTSVSQTTAPTTDLTYATTTSITSSLEALLQISSDTLSQTLPTLLREYSTSALQKSIHKLRLEYARLGPGRYLRASDIGNASGGYYKPPSFNMDVDGIGDESNSNRSGLDIGSLKSVALGSDKARDSHLDWMWARDGTEVRFTTLPWIERQLVEEWRTYEWKATTSLNESGVDTSTEHDAGEEGIDSASKDELIEEGDDEASNEVEDEDIGDEYERARTLAPRPLPKPEWEHASSCYSCDRPFGPTLHRHHCRRCGHSYCGVHSAHKHKLPHLGYDAEVPERVCGQCKAVLDSRDLQERVSWRLARCRDFLAGNLVPYFETGVDTVEDAAYRLTRLAISLARSIPLGAQAYVAIETVEVIRKHGLKGVYGLLLRKEFLAAADLLCRVLGINKKNWPLSVHELSAAIFYALAQHRALRGLRPDGEELIHSLKQEGGSADAGGSGTSNEKPPSKTANESSATSPTMTNESDGKQQQGKVEDEAGDTIVWQGRDQLSEPVLDETDVYDPTSEKVVDLLAMTASYKPIEASGKESRVNADAAQEEKVPTEPDDLLTTNSNTAAGTDLPFDPVCEHVPNSLISSLLFYAPLALDFIYAECEVDMQLLAAQQGWRLVYASLDQNHHHAHDRDDKDAGLGGNDHFSDKPASALFAHDEHKIACLSIRGTATIQDVVTDIRAMPVPFPQQQQEESQTSLDKCDEEEWTSVFRGNGLALCGMAGAAMNLFRETADSLLYLALRGYKIRIVGHSLGGGVAALLGILLLRHFERQDTAPSKPVDITEDGFVRVFSYGTPSCVDAKLADHPRTLTLVTSVVMHDDVVPRLTPTSVRGLLKHLLYVRETWVKTHLSDDLNAITERAYHVWPTRLRGSFTLLKKKGVASAKRLKKSYKKRVQGQPSSVKGDQHEEDCSPGAPEESCVADVAGAEYEDMSDTDTNVSVDEGVQVEGDLFFDPLDDPLNESDDESSVGGLLLQNTATADGACDTEWVPFDEPPMESSPDLGETSEVAQGGTALPQIDENDQSPGSDTTPQILEEMPLPRMFIPGRIVHIYTHRGGYKAAFVPRKFRSLRRISMAGNMLSDHMAKSYYEGLLEVKSVRAAKQELPPWVGFADDCTCACCASLFTWASTSNTEAQAARDKHNCRACGGLVCDPCSKKRVPIPAIGITVPVRVCDRCYNGWGTLYADLPSDDEAGSQEVAEASRKLDKSKGSGNTRRSAVVDELASRIPSIAS